VSSKADNVENVKTRLGSTDMNTIVLTAMYNAVVRRGVTASAMAIWGTNVFTVDSAIWGT
jgi:hypothetical protein